MKLPNTLSLPEMKTLLSELRTYSDMTKKLWKRGRDLFSKNLTGEKTFNVEYYPALWEDAAWAQAQTVFDKSFSLTPKREQVCFTELESVKWGMKVYVDDMMVDMSFDAVEKKIQK